MKIRAISQAVIPAQAGIQTPASSRNPGKNAWTPAFAGVTIVSAGRVP